MTAPEPHTLDLNHVQINARVVREQAVESLRLQYQAERRLQQRQHDMDTIVRRRQLQAAAGIPDSDWGTAHRSPSLHDTHAYTHTHGGGDGKSRNGSGGGAGEGHLPISPSMAYLPLSKTLLEELQETLTAPNRLAQKSGNISWAAS